MSERAGRYQRSMSGMVGALAVTLAVITSFVVWRAINRDDLEVRPERVDYLATVRFLEESGEPVIYPPSLPAGWTPTSANYVAGREFSWGMGALTADGEFAGLREEDTSVEQLVSDHIDEDATEGEPVELVSPLATSWRSFTDAGGDYGLVTEIGAVTLLVFGSADPDEIRRLAASLVTGPPS